MFFAHGELVLFSMATFHSLVGCSHTQVFFVSKIVRSGWSQLHLFHSVCALKLLAFLGIPES